MDIFLARQPIFDKHNRIYGYEFLYRNSVQNSFAEGVDAIRATQAVMSNLFSEFDTQKLTNSRLAFVNFSKLGLIKKLPYLAPNDVLVVEILEDIELDDDVIEAIIELKENKYMLALDDFIASEAFADIMPYVDIIKVDFAACSEEEKIKISEKFKGSKILLAEKIETKEDYDEAIGLGCSLFQGYFFSKPILHRKMIASIGEATHLKLWRELSKGEVEFPVLAEIICQDVGMTSKLVNKMKTLEYYRGNTVDSITNMLVRMGVDGTRKWLLLILLREIGKGADNEWTKTALSRALMFEEMIKILGKSEYRMQAYMLGLFSVFKEDYPSEYVELLRKLKLNLGKDESKKKILRMITDIESCVIRNEKGEFEKNFAFAKKYNLRLNSISELYIQSLLYANEVFSL